MRKKSFYLFTIVIGVFAAAFFLYNSLLENQGAALPPTQEQEAASNVFPAPGKTSYNMKLYLDTGAGVLSGQTYLETVNTSGKPLEELWFTAYPNAFQDKNHTPAPASAYYAGFNPGGMQITNVTINDMKAHFAEQGVSIQVSLPEQVLPAQNIKVFLQWQAQIPRVAYRFGSNHGVYMLGNFYPALNLLAADGWHNSYNSVFGDPFCFPCADYKAEVNIPAGYELIATGLNQKTITDDSGREIHLIEALNARDFCLVVVYDYSQITTSVQSTRLHCYTPGQDHLAASKVLEQSREIFNYYACTFGSYPYQEFKIVFVPMDGFHGMEYSGLIFLKDEFLQTGNEKRSEFLLAHEIAHQWWYSVVGNDQLKEPWLDEGLANWSAYKYLQDIKGLSPPPGVREYQGEKLTRELKEINSARDYYNTAYYGGEAFWFGLEDELGTDQVIKVLRKYFADFRYHIATTDDLKACIKSEARQDMDAYFQRWFKD